MHAIDLAHLTEINQDLFARVVLGLDGLCSGSAHELIILAGQAHGSPALVADQPDDILIDASPEHHFYDIHRWLIGDSQPRGEARLDAKSFQGVRDLRATAMDHDDPNPHVSQQTHVASKTLLQLLVDHRVAAVLHDEGALMKATNIRERLVEYLRFANELVHGRGE